MLASILLFCAVALSDVATMYSSKQIEGYPSGFMADCPGTTNEAIITERSFRRLTLTVQRKDNYSSKRTYTYREMKELARDPDLDFNKKTMLYVGGYMDSPSFIFASNIATTYKDLGYNVLLLDTNYFTTMEYQRAARIMRAVGKRAAKMLAELTEYGLNPKKLEIVGLSLGGQTASFVAKNYKQITGITVSRLTGLDPAGPCFRNLGPNDRIDKSDADFVEIIATNIDGYGMAAPAGHLNFYVNGGEFQPGDFVWEFCNTICSHVRSYFLWMSAIQNPKSFIGIKCDSVQQARERQCYSRQPLETAVLELNIDRSKQGIYYLNTDNKYPYYLAEKGLLRENDFFLSHSKTMLNESVIKM